MDGIEMWVISKQSDSLLEQLLAIQNFKNMAVGGLFGLHLAGEIGKRNYCS